MLTLFFGVIFILIRCLEIDFNIVVWMILFHVVRLTAVVVGLISNFWPKKVATSKWIDHVQSLDRPKELFGTLKSSKSRIICLPLKKNNTHSETTHALLLTKINKMQAKNLNSPLVCLPCLGPLISVIFVCDRYSAASCLSISMVGIRSPWPQSACESNNWSPPSRLESESLFGRREERESRSCDSVYR